MGLLASMDLQYKPADHEKLSAYFNAALPKEDATNDTIHWVYLLDKVIVQMQEIGQGLDYSTRESPIFCTHAKLDEKINEARIRMGKSVRVSA